MKRLLGLLLLIGLAFTSTASADRYNNGYIRTVNDTKYRAWITTYNVFRHQINYGWLFAYHDIKDWHSCCYVADSHYYVRAEAKEVVNGQMHQIFDTTIQVVPVACKSPNGNGVWYGYGRVVLRQGVGKTFYWDRADERFRSACKP